MKKPPAIASNPDQGQNARFAKILMGSSVNIAVVTAYTPKENVPDVLALYEEANKQKQRLVDTTDALPQAESMLLAQAVALQSMFVQLAERASRQDHREWVETLTKLALRAQSNCTQSLKTLGDLRAPRQVQFIRQANVTTGPQQVNNGAPVRAPAQESVIPPIKLMEQFNEHQRMDTGKTQASVGADQKLEAMAEIDRPVVRKRKSQSQS